MRNKKIGMCLLCIVVKGFVNSTVILADCCPGRGRRTGLRLVRRCREVPFLHPAMTNYVEERYDFKLILLN